MSNLTTVVQHLVETHNFVVVKEATTGIRLQQQGRDWSIFLCRNGRVDFTGIESPSMTPLPKQPTALVKACVKGKEQFEKALSEIAEGNCTKVVSQRLRSAAGELKGW